MKKIYRLLTIMKKIDDGIGVKVTIGIGDAQFHEFSLINGATEAQAELL